MNIIRAIVLVLVSGPITGLLIELTISNYRAGNMIRASGFAASVLIFNTVLLTYTYNLVRGHV